jgi:GH15 family glucan-1,4-alpha-glucosidase
MYRVSMGLCYLGVLDVDDDIVTTALKTVEAKLSVAAESRGYVRYEGDTYYTMQEAGSPNPWVITTLFVAQLYIARAKKPVDLEPALEILKWTTSHAGEGGTLAEQMHPHTREHKSAAPTDLESCRICTRCRCISEETC